MPWRSHRKYVSCVAQAVNQFATAGLILATAKGDLVSVAGQPSCGQ